MENPIPFLLLLFLTACSLLETEEPAEGNLQFLSWLESESIVNDFRGREVIPVLRTNILCEHLDCDEELTLEDKRVVFWSREELFQRGFPDENTLIVGLSEQDGVLYFNR